MRSAKAIPERERQGEAAGGGSSRISPPAEPVRHPTGRKAQTQIPGWRPLAVDGRLRHEKYSETANAAPGNATGAAFDLKSLEAHDAEAPVRRTADDTGRPYNRELARIVNSALASSAVDFKFHSREDRSTVGRHSRARVRPDPGHNGTREEMHNENRNERPGGRSPGG